jgi:hypothetical protein
MAGAMAEASYALRDTVDQFIAGKYTDADAGNLIGSTGTPKTDVSRRRTNLRLRLPRRPRRAARQRERAVRTAGSRSSRRGTRATCSRTTVRRQRHPGQRRRPPNGRIGRPAGFDLYKSNNVPNTAATKYRIVAGHPMAWSYAEQIVSIEAYRPQAPLRRRGQGPDGLRREGRQAVRPWPSSPRTTRGRGRGERNRSSRSPPASRTAASPSRPSTPRHRHRRGHPAPRPLGQGAMTG